MKYKTTVDNIEIELTKEQIKELIKNNPELLEDTKVSGRYFFPKIDEHYYYVNENGDTQYWRNDMSVFNNGRNIEMGAFKTREEALLARDKQKAIVACWKWAQENAPFEPDWSNEYERKYYVYYNFDPKKIDMRCANTIKTQFALPHFKSKEYCEKFIEANKANLELLFTK